MIGKSLGPYQVVAKLGEGGMGACGRVSERPFDDAQGRPELVEGRSETSARGAGVGPRAIPQSRLDLAHSGAR